MLWHLVMPALTRIFGYFPGRRLHLLEDLPAGVAFQWAARRKPDFWWNLKLSDGSPIEALIQDVLRRFRAIKAKTLAIEIADDPFATKETTDRLLGLFSNCDAQRISIHPNDVGASSIGHFGYFRSRFRDTLWHGAVEWLGGGIVVARG